MSHGESPETIDVVCLVLVRNNHFLAAARPAHKALGGFWEFPGGKVEPGEKPETALRRELREELELEIGEVEPLPISLHAYEFATIRMIPFLSKCSTLPTLRPTEHSEIRWVNFVEALKLKWAPADIPIVEYLPRFLDHN